MYRRENLSRKGAAVIPTLPVILPGVPRARGILGRFGIAEFVSSYVSWPGICTLLP